MNNQNSKIATKTFITLWFLCILGAWSVLPYVQYLNIVPSSVSFSSLIIQATVQSALFFGLICWLSYKILPRTDLNPFHLGNISRQLIYPAVISGMLVGLLLYLSDKTMFKTSLLSGKHPPFWAGALASLYGAINEEVLLRLFLFSLLYFLFQKWMKGAPPNRGYVLWSVNILVALIFGLGHLPAAFKLSPPSAFEVFRVLYLNGVAGLVFGWLYWSRGIWTAMGAHFVTDLMIHVFLI